MVKKIFLALFLALIGFAVYLYAYLGFSQRVDISVGERGPLFLLYKEHLGAYHQIDAVIDSAERWATENNVRCAKTFGEFLDDPKAIDQDRLRSRAGCVLDAAPSIPTPGFIVEEKPTRKYVMARFSGAPSIGPFKVYPRVQKFIDENRLKSAGPVIEIYTVSGEDVTTEYLFPVEN